MLRRLVRSAYLNTMGMYLSQLPSISQVKQTREKKRIGYKLKSISIIDFTVCFDILQVKCTWILCGFVKMTNGMIFDAIEFEISVFTPYEIRLSKQRRKRI